MYVSGCIPLDPQLAKSLEEGKDFQELFTESPTSSALNEVLQRLIAVDRDF